MKQSLTTLAAASLLVIMSCTKGADISQNTAASPARADANSANGHSSARYSGNYYSQSIPVDTANVMIMSYLGSVGYPSVDTAIRSMVFDADTLRAYLANSNIATVKFMFAHKQGYMNSTGTAMKPEAITMVVVGLNENDQYVLNARGEVYDHVANCPNLCPGTSNAIIQ